jgi:hypothetical protein
MIWTPGDKSGSQILNDLPSPNGDHLYPVHINELRQSIANTVIVDSVEGQGKYQTIEEAITALTATGGTIIINPGTYTYTNSIVIPANISIIGVNRDLVTISVPNASTSTYNCVFYVQGDNVSIENLTIQGNKANQTTNISGIYVSGGYDNSFISNIKIISPKYSGVVLQYCNRATVKNCYIENAGFRSIFIDTITNSVIKDNYVTGGGDTSISFENPSSYCLVTGNRLTSGLEFGIGIHTVCTFITVSNNIVDNMELEGIQVTGGNFITIVNNQFISTTTDYGVSFDGLILNTANIVFENNQIYGAYKNAIALLNIRFSKFDNNLIYRSMAQGTQGGYGAINIDETSSKNSIKNNIIIDDRATKLHVYGIYEATGADYNNISNNEIHGYVTGAVNKTGAHSLAVNNLSTASV